MNKYDWDKQWEELQSETYKVTSLDLFGEKAYSVLRNWISENDKKILEAGSGTGRFCIQIAKDKSNSMVVGVDNSKSAVKCAREGARIRDLRNAYFVQGDIFNLPFPNEYFDIVFNEGVIEHFHNYEDAVDEMVRVTKKGGKVITAVPNWYCFPHTTYKKIVGDNYKYGYEKSFKHRELTDLYNKFGLKNIEISGFHPTHSINRLSKFLVPLGYFIDKTFVIPFDKLTENSVSKYFGIEIVIKGIKNEHLHIC